MEVTVDVERLVVAVPAAGIEAPFPLDAFTQHRLLEGLDDIGLTLRHADDIAAYEQQRPAWIPVDLSHRRVASLPCSRGFSALSWALPRSARHCGFSGPP